MATDNKFAGYAVLLTPAAIGAALGYAGGRSVKSAVVGAVVGEAAAVTFIRAVGSPLGGSNPALALAPLLVAGGGIGYAIGGTTKTAAIGAGLVGGGLAFSNRQELVHKLTQSNTTKQVQQRLTAAKLF